MILVVEQNVARKQMWRVNEKVSSAGLNIQQVIALCHCTV